MSFKPKFSSGGGPRAGEHGKGFAVVAEEVAQLASGSGNAAKEINELLVKSKETVTKIIDNTKNRVSKITSNQKEAI